MKVCFQILFYILLTSNLVGQTISGLVYTQNYDSPAIGAAVMIKGTNRGVLTDMEGKFTLNLNPLDSVLEISLIDFYPLEIRLDTLENFNFSLENTPIILADATIKAYYSIDDNGGCVKGILISKINKNWDIDMNSSLYRHFIENIQYPAIATENGIEGIINVQFKIDTLGQIQDLQVLNKNKVLTDKSLFDAVLHSFEGIPTWTREEIDNYGGIGGYFSEGKYWTGIYRFKVKFNLIKE